MDLCNSLWAWYCGPCGPCGPGPCAICTLWTLDPLYSLWTMLTLWTLWTWWTLCSCSIISSMIFLSLSSSCIVYKTLQNSQRCFKRTCSSRIWFIVSWVWAVLSLYNKSKCCCCMNSRLGIHNFERRLGYYKSR